VCVVEAPAKSGALLFAAEALEQGREIFAVPGNADAENAAGIMALLKQGARPAACGWDVLEDFAAVYPDRLRRPNGEKCQAPDPEPIPARVKSAKKAPASKAGSDEALDASTKKEIDKQTDAGYIDLHDQLKALSEDQLQIVTAISRGETHIDDIIEATGMGAAKVLSQLTILEIKGYIRRVAGRRVSLNITQK
jgi:DNA processing protein